MWHVNFSSSTDKKNRKKFLKRVSYPILSLALWRFLSVLLQQLLSCKNKLGTLGLGVTKTIYEQAAENYWFLNELEETLQNPSRSLFSPGVYFVINTIRLCAPTCSKLTILTFFTNQG